MVCRNRAPFFAEDATAGTLQAARVADRWHPWHNLEEATEQNITQHRRCLHVLLPEGAETSKPEPSAEQSGSPCTYGT